MLSSVSFAAEKVKTHIYDVKNKTMNSNTGATQLLTAYNNSLK